MNHLIKMALGESSGVEIQASKGAWSVDCANTLAATSSIRLMIAIRIRRSYRAEQSCFLLSSLLISFGELPQLKNSFT